MSQGQSDLGSSFLTKAETIDKYSVDNAFLHQYHKETFEGLLSFLVGKADRNRTHLPNENVIRLLLRAKLMSYQHRHRDMAEEEHEGLEDSNALHITHYGFQFLLQSRHIQLWTLLVHYLEAQPTGSTTAEQLILLIKLSFVDDVDVDYDAGNLSPSQQSMLSDLVDMGFVFQRKASSRRFYPTPAVRHLLFTKEQFSSHSLSLIVESNYHVYAYTTSDLQIAILSLFIALKARFPNFVIGSLSRESCLDAFKHGITSDQIISFMTHHAHPQMKREASATHTAHALPATLIDQIKLWELEQHRITLSSAYLLCQFMDSIAFDKAHQYAQQIECLLLVVPQKRMLVVTPEGHTSVLAYMKQPSVRK